MNSISHDIPDEMPPLVEVGHPQCEKLAGIKVDVGQLRKHLEERVLPHYEPIIQSHGGFGGWSVYSANGHYDDGWLEGHKLFENVDGKMIFNTKKAMELGMSPLERYRVPTEVCHGYLARVMLYLQDLGFKPKRARLSLVKPHAKTAWHRDANDDEYAIRIHIPIITSPNAFFMTRNERFHMPADGSVYVVRVNCMHNACNLGDETRYHLIMQAWDHAGRTQFNKFDPNVSKDAKSPYV